MIPAKGGHGGPLHLRLVCLDPLAVNVGVALRGHPFSIISPPERCCGRGARSAGFGAL